VAAQIVPETSAEDTKDGSDRGMSTEHGEWGDGAATNSYLQTRNGGALDTVRQEQREWIFPGADEIFRGIYTRAGTGFTSEVLAVCSAIAGEGKTTVAVGLATTIAQDFPERSVLLVETDFQRATLAEDFGIEAVPGLIDCIISAEPWQSACRPTYLENLHVVPVGGTQPFAGRPLRSSRIAAIVDAMRQSYDLIVMDLPPIMLNTDAVLLSDLADGAICVVRAGVTPMPLVNKALEHLEDGKLRGVVLNGSQSAVPGWLTRLVGL
jgi:protein-tyrosine kinase